MYHINKEIYVHIGFKREKIYIYIVTQAGIKIIFTVSSSFEGVLKAFCS